MLYIKVPTHKNIQIYNIYPSIGRIIKKFLGWPIQCNENGVAHLAKLTLHMCLYVYLDWSCVEVFNSKTVRNKDLSC